MNSKELIEKLKAALSQAWELGSAHNQPSFEILAEWRALLNENPGASMAADIKANDDFDRKIGIKPRP